MSFRLNGKWQLWHCSWSCHNCSYTSCTQAWVTFQNKLLNSSNYWKLLSCCFMIICRWDIKTPGECHLTSREFMFSIGSNMLADVELFYTHTKYMVPYRSKDKQITVSGYAGFDFCLLKAVSRVQLLKTEVFKFLFSYLLSWLTQSPTCVVSVCSLYLLSCHPSLLCLVLC